MYVFVPRFSVGSAGDDGAVSAAVAVDAAAIGSAAVVSESENPRGERADPAALPAGVLRGGVGEIPGGRAGPTAVWRRVRNVRGREGEEEDRSGDGEVVGRTAAGERGGRGEEGERGGGGDGDGRGRGRGERKRRRGRGGEESGDSWKRSADGCAAEKGSGRREGKPGKDAVHAAGGSGGERGNGTDAGDEEVCDTGEECVRKRESVMMMMDCLLEIEVNQ